MHNPIAFAVPLFLVALAVELGVARHRRRTVMRFDDALGDLACGVTSQGIGLVLKLATIPLYGFVFQHGALFDLSAHPVVAWTLGLVGYDLCYYWWHRKSHEWNALWSVHVVHHQSDDFNLAVALRQDWLGPVTSIFFGLPLAVLGVPPLVYLTAVSVSLLYQFWIHTELIGKLGAFERVFNTPSHHRVHHGTNHAYLDKNFGGILIVWDRLFGTFELEVETPAYGVTTQFASFDATHANLSPWTELAAIARTRTGLLAKLHVLIEPPGFDVEQGRVVLGVFEPQRPKHRSVPLSPAAYAFLLGSFALATCFLLWMLWHESELPLYRLGLGVVALLAVSSAWSGCLEGRPNLRSFTYTVAATICATLAWWGGVSGGALGP